LVGLSFGRVPGVASQSPGDGASYGPDPVDNLIVLLNTSPRVRDVEHRQLQYYHKCPDNRDVNHDTDHNRTDNGDIDDNGESNHNGESDHNYDINHNCNHECPDNRDVNINGDSDVDS
jgi:hypothetical protein